MRQRPIPSEPACANGSGRDRFCFAFTEKCVTIRFAEFAIREKVF